MEEIDERTTWEIWGFPPGAWVYRKLNFGSENQVDDVVVWFQHSVYG